MWNVDITVSQQGNTRSYQFDKPVKSGELNWLNSNRSIQSYQVSGETVQVTASPDTNWEQLELDFIIPGLERTFGKLNVKSESGARSHA